MIVGRHGHNVLVVAAISLMLASACGGDITIVVVNDTSNSYLLQDREDPRRAWVIRPLISERMITSAATSLVLVTSDCTIKETITTYKGSQLTLHIESTGAIEQAHGPRDPTLDRLPIASPGLGCGEPRLEPGR